MNRVREKLKELKVTWADDRSARVGCRTTPSSVWLGPSQMLRVLFGAEQWLDQDKAIEDVDRYRMSSRAESGC
jgi:hypothetical protein